MNLQVIPQVIHRFRQPAALSLLLCSLGIAPLAVHAQDAAPARVLVVQREFTKPGKGGALHEKTEGVYIHALAAAKASQRYYAVTSLSGPSRALFLSGYPSFAAWEAENKTIDKDAALSAALDKANVADGDLLSDTDASVWILRDDLSLNAHIVTGGRLLEINQFGIRPGHRKEWEDLVKLVIDAYKKGVPHAHFGCYEEAYGTPGGRYVCLTMMKSAAEIDASFGEDDKQFAEAMGESGMKKLSELEAASIESRQTNLFQINPKLSYPPDEWIKAEPDFWKPKAAAPAKKPAQ